jgi:uncharacterized repeat protein (TIGR01451 family)
MRWTRQMAAAAGAATLLAGLSAWAGPGSTPEGPRLSVDVQVRREVVVTDGEGRRQVRLEAVRQARPGDVLVYTLEAANAGGSPAIDARLEDPIPAGTVLLPDSVQTRPRPVSASVDGGATWQPFPVQVRRTAPDGTVGTEAAPDHAYTHLRWLLRGALLPGETATVSFKVRVL